MFTSILNEHKGFGKQIMLLSKNELIKTYKGAVIGPLWAVVKPAFTVFVYWFAFSVGIKKLRDVGVNLGGPEAFSIDFFTFMFVGIIPWFFIQDSIVQGSKTLRTNRQFITKVKFPVSTILTYTGLSRLYVHLFLAIIMYDSYSFKGFLKYAMLVNPINFFANGYRNCFLYNRWFFEYKTEFVIFMVEFVVVFLLGIYNYNRLRKKLPDVL